MSAERVATTVPLDWNEVWFTNCPMVSANNVDQELGWCREEFKKLGVEYAFFRSVAREQLVPALRPQPRQPRAFRWAVPADPRQRRHPTDRLLGATQVYEGGAMLVRARDDIFRMEDLRGKKIGLTKSLNTIKNDWWRIQEHAGIELMLRINGMTMDDVEIVEFPYPDDWYDKPEMLQVEMNNPSELWLRRDHKHDLAFRPLETGSGGGRRRCDLHAEQGVPAPAGGHRQVQGDRGPVPPPGLDHADGQLSRGDHVHRCHGRRAPRAGRRLHEGDDQGRSLGQREQARRRWDPQPPDVLSRRRGHLPGDQGRRHGAQPVAEEPGVDRHRQGLHVEPRLHRQRLRRQRVGGAGVPRAGRPRAPRGGMDPSVHLEAPRADRLGVPGVRLG